MYFNKMLTIILIISSMLSIGAVCESLNPATIIGDSAISDEFKNSYYPKAVYNHAVGEYIATWMEESGGSFSIALRRISNIGEHLSGVIEIASEGYYPYLVSANEINKLYLSYWHDANFSNFSIVELELSSTFYDDVSTTFEFTLSEALTASPTASDVVRLDYDPSLKLAWSGEELAFCYPFIKTKSDELEYDVKFASFNPTEDIDPTTSTITMFEIILGNTQCSNNYPQLKWNNNDNQYIVTWRQKDGDQYGVYYQTIGQSGQNVGAYNNLETVSMLARNFSLVSNGSVRGIFWHDLYENNLNIMFRNFSKPSKLIIPTTNCNDLLPSADSDGNTISAVWQNNEEGPYKLRYCIVSPNDNSVSSYFKIERPYGEARNAYLTWANDEYAMCWQDKRKPFTDEAAWIIYFARLYAEGTKKEVGRQ